MVLRNAMNLSLTVSSPSFRSILAVLAAIMLVCPGAVSSAAPARAVKAAAARADKADEAVLLARDAFRTGNAQMLARAAAQARGHVLEPYVEYWQLRLRLEGRGGDGVRDFLARHQGTLIAGPLSSDWLRVLGKKGDWDA